MAGDCADRLALGFVNWAAGKAANAAVSNTTA
jgi:hypothetical protein